MYNKSMALHSQTAFAKLAGVSRPAIIKALKNGKLKKNENKQVDDQHPLSLSYLNKQIHRGKKDLLKTRSKTKITKTIKKPDKIKLTEKKETIIKDNQIKPEIPNKAQVMQDVGSIKINSYTPDHEVLQYQEIFKAVKLQEEALTKQLQRKEKEKSLIDVEMGKFVFTSFIDQAKTELSLITSKHSPSLKSLYKNDQDKKAEKLLNRAFESMLDIIVKAQKKELEKWKREK